MELLVLKLEEKLLVNKKIPFGFFKKKKNVIIFLWKLLNELNEIKKD